MAKRVTLVGDGKVALDCLKILNSHPGVDVGLVLFHEDKDGATRTRAFCEKQGLESLPIENVNDPAVAKELARCEPEFFFSIGSFDILRRRVLSIPTEGTINYHNGPLPGLRGVNVPSWAIITGRTEHGVSWHLVNEGIDTGPVIARRVFPIHPHDTAIRLIFRCVQEGVALFEEMLDSLIQGDYVVSAQNGVSAYYSKKDIPNRGFLDFLWKVDEASRFVRGLDFRPFDNPMAYPKVRVGGSAFVTHGFRKVEASLEGRVPGEIVSVTDEGVSVEFADGVGRLEEITDLELQPLTPGQVMDRFCLSEGYVLEG